MVRLLEADDKIGLMLLERIVPGDSLQNRLDEGATSVFSGMMRRLRWAMPEKGSFPTVADWANGFARLRDL